MHAETIILRLLLRISPSRRLTNELTGHDSLNWSACCCCDAVGLSDGSDDNDAWLQSDENGGNIQSKRYETK